MKFRLTTLGCRTNQYETQGFRDQLLAIGHQEAAEGERADLCIVNTCTVTENADKASIQAIRSLEKENQASTIVLTGCFAEQQKAKEIFGDRIRVISNKQKEDIISLLFPDEEVPEFSIKNFEAHTRAFVKVQDGCNSFCTYCIIPYVRGRSRSRPIEAILKEVEDLIANGYQDIVLTGINVGDFQDRDINLAELIRRVDRLQGLQRLRLSSIDPDEVDDDLMDAILNGKRTCHSLHIVLQSGSNAILKRMNRKYTRQIFLETVEKLEKASQDFTFTTDVIVGFPGETEKDFLETCEVLKRVQFAKVHMFPYSKRERTRAALYPNQVAPDVIKERKQHILHVAEEIAFSLRSRFLGREMSVLIEQNEKDGRSFGHTANFLGVYIPSSTSPNQLVSVKLIENTPQGLVGILL